MSPNAANTPLRLVLDTHIWLEWLLWRSPRIEPLRTGHATGLFSLFHSSASIDEWRRVLGYPQFALAEPQIHALVDELRALTQLCEPSSELAGLPQCRDPDDQKFLELAVQSSAHYLLTRDKKLLKIGRHKHYKQRGLQVMALERFYPLVAAISSGLMTE